MRKYTLKYTISLALGISLVIFIFYQIENLLLGYSSPSLFGQVILNLIFALIAGSVLSGGIFRFIPTLSDAMATLRRMLRIENLSSPLLLRLSGEAPGTYHHSLNVSALANKAAKAIGADSLLIRTAAYYHDIGKLSNPKFFIENQSEEEISSEEEGSDLKESSEAIIAHVENGVKLAEESNLPDEIINLIREHHGNMPALYFYAKAKEKGLKVKKTDFRYKGPRPSSRESAILMLADCVEATVKATSNLTPDRIFIIVNNAITERESDNQFKNSGLIKGDLEKISESLFSTIKSIYHQRIEYKNGNN